MKKLLIILLIALLFLSCITSLAYATGNPLSVPNNKFGVHILFPSELSAAAKLINSNGGDWGYVIIPIQSGDKDLQKWQEFFNQAKKLHIIPVVRLATQGDYFNTSVWSTPTYSDVLDFANFLGSLSWPTQNRYVIVYNEVNRNDEWGGKADPSSYAQILSYGVTAFKSKSPDFFIISAGLDNASANSSTAINEYTFLQEMNDAVPGIFNQIDGIGSHSYPNPGFSQPPTVTTQESIASFKYEQQLIDSYTSKQLPIFITETGWSRSQMPDKTIAGYFQYAFANVWNDSSIVTVSPFLLTAGTGPFTQFSLLSSNLSDTPISAELKSMPKIKGQPSLTPDVLAAETSVSSDQLPVKRFANRKTTINTVGIAVEDFFKSLIHIH